MTVPDFSQRVQRTLTCFALQANSC